MSAGKRRFVARREAFGAGLLLLSLLTSFSVAPTPAKAHTSRDPQDAILEEVGVDEKLGDAVPLDLAFSNQGGESVRLGDYVDGAPVLLTLNYFTCPMLCPLTLANLLDAVRRMGGISLGRDFRIVTVSIDPDETLEAARGRAAEMYARMPGVARPEMRWPFLFGDGESAGALARAVGVRYRKVGAEFAHPNVAIVLTPGGRISRYLYGMEPSPGDLKLGLIEAAGGRIGESGFVNQVLLYCFHYDPVGRKYALYARNIMKAGGLLTLALVAAMYLVLWRRRRMGPNPKDGGPE